jgi:hypothetical protein
VELSDITKSLSECTDEELHAMLIGIRNSRRTPKSKPVSKPRAARGVKAKKEASIESLLGSMNKDQIELLLKSLGG